MVHAVTKAFSRIPSLSEVSAPPKGKKWTPPNQAKKGSLKVTILKISALFAGTLSLIISIPCFAVGGPTPAGLITGGAFFLTGIFLIGWGMPESKDDPKDASLKERKIPVNLPEKNRTVKVYVVPPRSFA